MISNRSFFLLIVPIAWSFGSVIHFNYPGDEYAMWGISSLAGSWVLFVVPSVGDIGQPWIRASVAGTGALVMAAVGWLLCWLRIQVRFWCVLWLVSFLAWLGYMLSQYPSMESALAKNGSLLAYLLSAALLATYCASLLGAVAGLIKWAVRRSSRPVPPGSVPNPPTVP